MNDSNINLLKTGKHVTVLDGLRGFAVSYVLLYHFFPKTLSVKYQNDLFLAWDSFWLMGWSGVDLFFVLSGFLITGILYTSKTKANYFKNFYLRRVLRIFPIYYLLIIIFLLIVPLVVNKKVDTNAIWYFLFLSNFDTEIGLPMHPYLVVAWSLAIEEQYYLFYPAIVYKLNLKKWLNLLLIIIILSVLIRFLGHYFSFLTPRQMYHFTLAHFDGIALGGVLRLLLFDFDKNNKLINLYLKLTPFFVLLSVVIAFYTSNIILNEYSDNKKLGHISFNSTMYLYGYFINGLTYGGILLWSVLKNGFLSKFFNFKPLRLIGKYSFAMYLFQYIAKDIYKTFIKIFNFSNSYLSQYTIYTIFEGLAIFLICFLLAKLSWILIEGPANNLKKKFA